jgi:hypothetical protein
VEEITALSMPSRTHPCGIMDYGTKSDDFKWHLLSVFTIIVDLTYEW